MQSFASWKKRVQALKQDTFALGLACRDPRVPWYAKALALVVVGYALSPIDLIPDFIPVLGYLDDLVLIPLGMMLVVRLIPAGVLAECRRQAEESIGRAERAGKIAAAVILLAWLLIAILLVRWSLRLLAP
ncbi:MAG: YkvA family protein [Deltaproteobacteria bacterium]|nr:YkvA family protein [Deltaproteobacteria bacterium]